MYDDIKPFSPVKLPIESSEYVNHDTLPLILEANRHMGEYKGFLSTIINPLLLISPIISQEAVLSSKLEGTHATLEDVMNYERSEERRVGKECRSRWSRYK